MCLAFASAFPGRLAHAQPTSEPAAPGLTKPQFSTRELPVEEAMKERARLNAKANAAFKREDIAEAESALRELIPLDHQNFVPWYNLACALSLQGKLDESAQMLRQSIARGFSNIADARIDPDLAQLRASPEFSKIVSSWDQTIRHQGQRRFDALKTKYRADEKGSKYQSQLDAANGLAYVSGFDPALFKDARAQIDRLNRWWRESVLPEAPALRADTQPDGSPTPEVLVTVLLPARPDFRLWAQERFGDLWDRIGGSYSNDEKSLVAMDLGSSMRHEFWHVLHWRHMDRLRQRHPIWVMEGLCSLVEDADESPTGAMVPKPSWRTNIVRRLARAGSLTPWDQLFGLDQSRFIRSRPLAMYAQTRGVFLFLSERGKLRDWYTAFVRDFKEDPTGLSAFASAFKKPTKEVEREFRVWARNLPEVPEEIGKGPANLPFELSPGVGEGPVVSEDDLFALIRAPGAAKRDREAADRAGGIRPRDTITAIDAEPVRDFNDLSRALSNKQAGDIVEVSYKRRSTFAKAKVTLVPPRY